MTLVALAVFLGAYALIATERLHRTAVALSGAALMLLLKVLTAEKALHSPEVGIDWAVIALLLGMMLIVAVIRQTGLFEYVAIWSAKRARGRPYRILVILSLVTAAASALLDNVTTVLLVAPATILIAERLGMRPAPLLIAEALASNIGGTATLVGDPPNIVIASAAGLSYGDFLTNLAPVVLLILALFLAMARFLFRRDLRADPGRVAEVMRLDEREAIRDPALLRRALAVLAAVTVGFLLHRPLGYEPATVALLGGGLLLLAGGRRAGELLREVEWETLAFFIGLFVMVGGLVEVGVMDSLARTASEAVGGSLLLAATVILVVSGVASGIVDNIPYATAMAPVVGQLSEGLAGTGVVLWWALALGAGLGGNATAVGAGANVVLVGIASRAGHPIRFSEFLRYGLAVTAMSIAVSGLYVWLRYFALRA